MISACTHTRLQPSEASYRSVRTVSQSFVEELGCTTVVELMAGFLSSFIVVDGETLQARPA